MASGDPDTAAVLDSLRRAGLSLIVDCDDFNCDEALPQTAYNLPVGTVKVLSGKEHSAGARCGLLPESEAACAGQLCQLVWAWRPRGAAENTALRWCCRPGAHQLHSCHDHGAGGGLAGLPLPARPCIRSLGRFWP
ncbi:MAG: hypothetical protein ACLVHY_03675 [Gemmiger sp.]